MAKLDLATGLADAIGKRSQRYQQLLSRIHTMIVKVYKAESERNAAIRTATSDSHYVQVDIDNTGGWRQTVQGGEHYEPSTIVLNKVVRLAML